MLNQFNEYNLYIDFILVSVNIQRIYLYFQVLKVDGVYVVVKFLGTFSNVNCQSSFVFDVDFFFFL